MSVELNDCPQGCDVQQQFVSAVSNKTRLCQILPFPLALQKLVMSEYLIKLVISTQKSERRKEAEVKRL